MAYDAMASAPLEVVVVGSGTMGTALAHVVARAGHASTLVTDDAAVRAALARGRRHPRHFPEHDLHPALRVAGVDDGAIERAGLLVMAVPSPAMAGTARRIAPRLDPGAAVLSATKGFDPQSHRPMSAVLAEALSTAHVGALCGPNITLDLVRGLPTALVVASPSARVRARAARALAGPGLRVEAVAELAAYEHVAALKNIVALEVGLVTGLGLGDNLRAVALVRGLAEIERLLSALGLDPRPLGGLAGLADVFLTCCSPFARNYAVGVDLGRGAEAAALLATLDARGETAEGVGALRAGHAFARARGVACPLLEATFAVVHGGAAPDPARFVRVALGDAADAG